MFPSEQEDFSFLHPPKIRKISELMELIKFLSNVSGSYTYLLVLLLCVDRSVYSLGFLLGIKFLHNSRKVVCTSHCLYGGVYL